MFLVRFWLHAFLMFADKQQRPTMNLIKSLAKSCQIAERKQVLDNQMHF